MRIVLASFLVLTILSGCGGVQDEVQTNQKTVTGSKGRYVVKEYDQRRAFMYDQSRVQNPDLAIRLSNEAERVFNVYQAVALVQGNDIIMGIATKTDPLETQQKTIKQVRQRLENKEPSLSNYNLYITVDQDLQQEIVRAKTNAENYNTDGYAVNQNEPQFGSILQKIQNQSR